MLKYCILAFVIINFVILITLIFQSNTTELILKIGTPVFEFTEFTDDHYRLLMESPEKYNQRSFIVQGTVIQVMSYYNLRKYLVFCLESNRTIVIFGSQKVLPVYLDRDVVAFKNVFFNGLQTYTTIFNTQKTVPEFTYVEFSKSELVTVP